MEKKNRAAKLINVALGLILIVTVILFSPVFGFAGGFSSPEQRQSTSMPMSGAAPQSAVQAPVGATPRPTAMPTPTPVVLPSAPPAPSPTPVPTPKPVAVQQPVQQAAQPVQQAQTQSWQPEEWAGEEGYEGYEEDGEAEAAPQEPQSYEGLGEQAENGVIATENADIVINTDMGGGSDTGGDMGGGDATVPQEPVSEPVVEYTDPVQSDTSEGEAFMIG